MFAFEPPYLPLICLLFTAFCAACGTLGAFIQFFRCANDPVLTEDWWIVVWAALALPGWVGAFGLWFMFDALRHGVYGG